ncbi:nucleotidyltransferase family protein [bacterium]|nr:nucleotidyltransferase family protein [bacterium]
MNAIISAGGTVKENDLLTGLLKPGDRKALLPIAGKPMIQWEIDALSKVVSVKNIIIIGLTESDGLHSSDKPVHYIPDAGGLIDNIKAGAKKSLELNPGFDKVLWFSSDVPLIQAQMIEWLMQESEISDNDLYYLIIEKSVMEARFPASKRSYTRLKDKTVCGGDFGIFKPLVASDTHPALPKISEARKSVIKQARFVGLRPLLALIFHRMTEDKAAMYIKKQLGLDLRLVNCPFAEAGMDVDKPFQYDIVKSELERAR